MEVGKHLPKGENEMHLAKNGMKFWVKCGVCDRSDSPTFRDGRWDVRTVGELSGGLYFDHDSGQGFWVCRIQLAESTDKYICRDCFTKFDAPDAWTPTGGQAREVVRTRKNYFPQRIEREG